MAGVVEAVRQFAAAHGLAGRGVVAVSGGADSVALLHALRDAGIGPLEVAHFDHRLREASAGDARFVEKLAAGLGLPYRLGSADVAAAAAAVWGNLEATGRQLRYDWLAKTAAEVGAAWVATGHTADDQAETVLHRLIRGTGIRGLRGIAGERPSNPSPSSSPGRGGEKVETTLPPPSLLGKGAGGLGSSRIVRPLLTVTRRQVLAYLKTFDLVFVEDASNADRRFTRNRIRHELLPLLRKFNPEIVAVLNRLAAQAAEETRERDARVAEVLAAAELPRAGGVLVFDADRLGEASDALLGDLFLRVWEREGWSRNGMTFAHWRRLAGIVRGGPAADFPDGVSARRVGRVVQLGRRS